MKQQILRNIPKMDIFLNNAALMEETKGMPAVMVKEVIQSYLQRLRTDILDGKCEIIPDLEDMIKEIKLQCNKAKAYSLRRVINGTGVVLHTNLGRAPMGRAAMEHLSKEVSGYCSLEYDLENGCRGSRYTHVEQLLCQLTGAESAMVVNNNAAAVFLMLNTLAKEKNVAISRGELVEIGGSFRVPEMMSQSGAHLVEVGTTNKTHETDYVAAITSQQAQVLLKVHTSNFKMVGFTEDVDIAQMAALGQTYGCPVFYDLGAAFLTDMPECGISFQDSLTVKQCVQSGADMVCFSGDKLLGSAQAGILLGKKKDIDRIRSNPFTRMFRIDKLSLAVLEHSLRFYKNPYDAAEQIPALKMMLCKPERLKEKAERLSEHMAEANMRHLKTELVCCQDEPGGGSLPGVYLDGYAVKITSKHYKAQQLERYFRTLPVPIIGRISNDEFLLSVRTLLDGDEEEITAAVKQLEASVTEDTL